MRTRRRFSAEFKETAVERLASRPVAEVARICDVSVSVLHRWRRKLGDHPVTPVEGRRRFTKEFKAYALERLEREGRERGASRERGAAHESKVAQGSEAAHGTKSTIAQVAAALDVPPNTLHRWRKEAREFGGHAFSGYGKSRAASQPARVIKISLHPGEYRRVLAAFENSSARSLPDFTRSQLLDATGEYDVGHDVEHHPEHHPGQDSDQAVERAYAEIHNTLDDLVGILRRMTLIYGAIYGVTSAATSVTCDSSSHSADSHAGRSRTARSHAAG
jgi:transposase-like protein